MAVPCPFVYADAKKCKGHIVRVEAYKADLEWSLQDDGSWTFHWGDPRSHFHAFCSLKGNHSGYDRPTDERMKFYGNTLPDELCAIVFRKRA